MPCYRSLIPALPTSTCPPWLLPQVRILPLNACACAALSAACHASCAPRFPAPRTERKAVIKNADMSEDMQQDAIDCAAAALEKFSVEKEVAAFIKKEFDRK